MEDRFLHAQGFQGGEEEPEVSAWARDTETTSPGHQGFSLRGEVSTCCCVSGVTSERQSGFTQSSERGGVAGSYVLFPGPLDVARPCPDTWPLSETTFADGLWSKWRLWGSPYVCKSSLWSSADGQEVNRILCVPKWALCLDSWLVPLELSGLYIYSPTLSSMCPSLCSTQEAEEWLLVAEILRAESNH